MPPPYQLGSRIRHLSQYCGTAGCLAYFADNPGQVFVLTASHVLAPDGVGSGDPIYLNNRLADVHDPGSIVGQLMYWTGLSPAGNTGEAALAWVDPTKITADIEGIGTLTGYNNSVSPGDALRFCGATSGVVEGMNVVAVGQDITLTAGTADRPMDFLYKNQIFCEQKDLDGDSGAAVVDDANRIVGLLVGAGSVSPFGNVTVVTPIAAIRNHPQWGGPELQILAALPAGAVAPPFNVPVVKVENIDSAVDTLARTIWGEDRSGGIAGDPAAGMKAVACVVINRVRKQQTGWGLTVEEVCKAPKQFSIWNPETVPGYRPKPGELSAYNAMIRADATTRLFPEAQVVARSAIFGQLADPTGGAHFYAAADFIDEKCADPSNARQFYCQGNGVPIADQIYFLTDG